MFLLILTLLILKLDDLIISLDMNLSGLNNYYNKTAIDNFLTNIQNNRLTSSLPLSINNNNLSIGLTSYATISYLNNKQNNITTTLPLSLTNNNLSID